MISWNKGATRMHESHSGGTFGQLIWRWLLAHAGWILWLMVLQTMLLYRHELTFQWVHLLKITSEWMANRQLQQKVAVEFVVKKPHQNKKIRFVSLLKRDTLVLMLSPNCRTCEVALAQLSHVDQRQLAAAEVDVMVLTPSELQHWQASSHISWYQISAGFQPELFETMLKPTLLKFNAQGKLLAKTAGWSHADFNRLAGLAKPVPIY
jgi:hypothetical protein